jgi:hypothetical protein
MHGLKSGSCRFWQRNDLQPGSKVVRADFGSGLICPRALTFCALKSSAPFGARQDNYADSGSACKLAGVQIIPLPK